MKENVVQMEAFRQNAAKQPPIQAEPVHLPKVYRLTGFGELAGASGIYALQPDAKLETENLKWVHVDKLDPEIDDGWVIVRHHNNPSELKGYVNSQMDLLNEEFSQVLAIGEDKHGLYSVIAREPLENTPNHLLIYVTSIDEMVEIEDVLTQPDIYFIYHPDGLVTYDPSIMFPFMKEAQKQQ